MLSIKNIVLAKLTWPKVILFGLFFALLLSKDLFTRGDFHVFFAAALRYLNGARVHLAEPSAFTYPAFTSMAFAPLALFGHTVAKLLAFCLTAFCMVVGISIINHYLLANHRRAAWVVGISILLELKYFIAVFNYQQTDLYVFALVVVGLHYYCQSKPLAALYWALAVLVKANPFFMVLLPLYQKKLKAFALLLVIVGGGLLLPDLLRPAPSELLTRQTVIDVPSRVIPKSTEPPTKSFLLVPANARFTHLQDYTQLLFTSDTTKWWQYSDNPLNQSLTITLLRLLPPNVLSPNVSFVLWCSFFSVLLFLLVRLRSADVFTLGVLFYSAFVLIGPMSSKPHFVALYGLLVYAWQDALSKPSVYKLVPLGAASLIFGFSSQGLLGNFAVVLSNYGHIGLCGLFFWMYVWVKEFSKLRSVDALPQ